MTFLHEKNRHQKTKKNMSTNPKIHVYSLVLNTDTAP